MAAKKPVADEAGALIVTQVKSGIGTKPKHRGTLRALGLRKIGQSSLLPDRPEIRGMLARVPHLVTIEPAAASDLENYTSGRSRRSDAHGASQEGTA
ncbi:MAG: rpmD [Acidimicrobiaceae bacterium]|jgi:large subunit ribosomal protein L30|nr:rpmD [Acidimicrobiaceae bacterium]